MSTLLNADLRANLDNKMRLFTHVTRLGEGAQGKAVIFTDDPDLWRKDHNPVFITTEPLPPIPPDYDPTEFDIAQEMNNYLKHLCAEAGFTSFSLISVEFGIVPRPEVHFVFHPHRLSNADLSRLYLKEDTFGASSSHASWTTMIPAVYCQYSAASGRNVPRTEVLIEWFGARGLPKSGRNFRTPERDDSQMSVSSPDDARLSQELKDHLDEKIRLFVFFNRVGGEEGKNDVIFTKNKDLWNTDRDPVMITIEPLPPIPPGYERKEFDIVHEMRDYLVRKVVGQTNYPSFTVASVEFGDVNRPEVHFIFSPSCPVGIDLARFYLRNFLPRPVPKK